MRGLLALLALNLRSIEAAYAYSQQGGYLTASDYPVPALMVHTVAGFDTFDVGNGTRLASISSFSFMQPSSLTFLIPIIPIQATVRMICIICFNWANTKRMESPNGF